MAGHATDLPVACRSFPPPLHSLAVRRFRRWFRCHPPRWLPRTRWLRCHPPGSPLTTPGSPTRQPAHQTICCRHAWVPRTAFFPESCMILARFLLIRGCCYSFGSRRNSGSGLIGKAAEWVADKNGRQKAEADKKDRHCRLTLANARFGVT